MILIDLQKDLLPPIFFGYDKNISETSYSTMISGTVNCNLQEKEKLINVKI